MVYMPYCQLFIHGIIGDVPVKKYIKNQPYQIRYESLKRFLIIILYKLHFVKQSRHLKYLLVCSDLFPVSARGYGAQTRETAVI